MEQTWNGCVAPYFLVVLAALACRHLHEGYKMDASTILKHLKTHGQLLDSEIAAATGMPLPKVRIILADLAARGEIYQCQVTRFPNGKPVEGVQCRIAGFSPPAAPGRKPKPKSQVSPPAATLDAGAAVTDPD